MQAAFCEKSGKFYFAIDRGGTFTDVWTKLPDGRERMIKLLSEDPKHYKDAPTEAIRRILEEEIGVPVPREMLIPTDRIGWIRMGTTVATNALLERTGERMALAVTKGFRDILHIGNQARPQIFDLEISCPDVLYEDVIEVEERILPLQDGKDVIEYKTVSGSTGEALALLHELDEEKLREDLRKVLAKGVTSLAVLLLHSYTYPQHEERVAAIASELGFAHVTLSSSVSPMIKAVPRGYTACSDAYLTPLVKEYLKSFRSGFQDELNGVMVSFMQSDGGLTLMDRFSGCRAILSGPAGGVVGYAATAYDHQPELQQRRNSSNSSTDSSVLRRTVKSIPDYSENSMISSAQDKSLSRVENVQHRRLPVIGFDMGGTSTDVSRYDGSYEHVFESTTAGVTVQAPQLDINTVAAGGGSRLLFHSGLFVVGPESAGANPGPVCYKKGGPLAVTDANLLLGRLLPEYFPKIFGPAEDQPLDFEATLAAFKTITKNINLFEESNGSEKRFSPTDVALGFIRVANEAMCRPIRALTQAKGYDTRRHVLAVFGGAGAQHACAVARSLGIQWVLIHRYAGALSAYGLALADTVAEAQEPCAKTYNTSNFAHLSQRIKHLESECRTKLLGEGFQLDCISCEAFLHLRYQGTDCALMCRASGIASDATERIAQEVHHDDDATTKMLASKKRKARVSQSKLKKTKGEYSSENTGAGVAGYGCFLTTFLDRYRREFGFVLEGREVLVDDIRVRGIARSGISPDHTVSQATGPPPVLQRTEVWLESGPATANVHRLSELQAGHSVSGPAVVLDNLSTIFIEPHCCGVVTDSGDLLISVGATSSSADTDDDVELDPVRLSVFAHRFMSIAEQMGRVLQRTAISTNIKERLDFSCAVFGPDGGLVSNAPHIPVHLGAMQETVQYQLHQLGDGIEEGDVFLSNHPTAGGSHLPDLTVITPVFTKGVKRPIFYVASRGHHADIGGITPGSMPPNSTSIHQEGAVFFSFKLVQKGIFQESALTKALMAPGKIPGSSGTRNLKDNLSDLKAQVAANQKGIQLVWELVEEYGLPVVQAYMGYIQNSAEMAVRDMLKELGQKKADCKEQDNNTVVLKAVDHMDDGSPICVTVIIHLHDGSAVIDFSGTGLEVWGNCNAPRAITVSAAIYCLRCLVGRDVPLNQGCLAPVQINIPEGCILNPSPYAAVVGGNVQTSQRIVDVLLKAFGACAASQGCMNNVTFGDEEIGYYETVAGGAGAGPHWHGRSGVHTHMTNTRITDPEILEIRYPIYLTTFMLRPHSGGAGKFRGGDGVVRELRFRRSLILSILTERRVFAPFGLDGGEDGQKGQNVLTRREGQKLRLPSKTSVDVKAGDVFRLETPGGGGYGSSKDYLKDTRTSKGLHSVNFRGSVHDFVRAQETA